jgi:arylsulfatase A-like enzyme
MTQNILFLVIDSLRHDKCYGDNKSSITPNIDSLIQDGTIFTNAISHVGSTGSSLASIFTGLFPFKTGMSSESYQKLNPNVKSFIHFLQENNYNTYAASPPTVDALGLTDNFENKNSNYDNYESIFSGLGDRIIGNFKLKKMTSPWFFYYHINDLHKPIIVPKDFDQSEFGDSNYEKMISALDVWIGKILKTIDLENTIVVLTSDHGDYLSTLSKEKNLNFESDSTEQLLWKFGNKIPVFMRPLKLKIANFIRKQRSSKKISKLKDLSLSTYEKRMIMNSRMGPGHHMYDDIVHVPLIITNKKIKSKQISQQVRHVDLFPTILDILDLKINHEVDGKSLLPLINNENFDELPAYIESPPTIEKSQPKMIGIRTLKYKYIRSLSEPPISIELYDLKNDANEEFNIADSSSEIVYEYNKILLDLRKDSLVDTDSDKISQKQNDEIENELRKMGYL